MVRKTVITLLMAFALFSWTNSVSQVKTFLCNKAVFIPTFLLEAKNGIHDITVGNEVFMTCLCSNKEISITKCHNVNEISDQSNSIFYLLSTMLSNKITNRIPSCRIQLDVETLKFAETISMISTQETVDWITDTGVVLLPLPRPVIHQFNLLHRGIGAVIINSNLDLFVHQRAANKRIFPSMWDMFVGGVCQTGESPHDTVLRELCEEVGLDSMDVDSDGVDQGAREGEGEGEGRGLSPASLSQFAQHFHRTFHSDSPRLGPSPSLDTDTGDSNLAVGDGVLHIGQTVVETPYNHCLVDCYAVLCSPSAEAGVRFNDGEVQRGRWMSLQDLKVFLEEERGVFVPDGLQVWTALPDML